jgi:hypothetical protein
MRGFTTESMLRDGNRPVLYWTCLIVILLCVLIYGLTAFRAITWWDNAEYSLAASTLGIAHPPGSLFITLIGWIIVKIPLGISAAYKLNLLAALAASLTAVLIILGADYYYCRLQISTPAKNQKLSWILTVVGFAIGALAFAFTETVWSYATKFTPYIFTALFTAAIIYALLRWWGESRIEKSYRWLFVLMLLLGLDFSVHRTNTLLLPGILIALVIGNWRVVKSIRSWFYGVLGYLIGLSFQLLVIPIAARQPFLNSGDPSNLNRFWDYISLKQYGGDWLINIFPRKASFFSYQIPDYLKIFAANFIDISSAVGIWGIFPAIFGIFGLIMHWKSNRRSAIVMLILFISASIGSILYFNLPYNYFRSNDRHYLPSLVIFAFWIALGCGFFQNALSRIFSGRKGVVFVACLIALLIMPWHQISKNYRQMDCSRNYFADNFGKNLLATLPENAILFTNGDIDTYTPWYYQEVERLRRDVAVVNLPLLNTPWFVSQLKLKDPDMPLSLTTEEIYQLNIKPWSDTTLYIPTKCDRSALGIPDSVSLPDSIGFHITPNIEGKYLTIQDWVLFQIISQNAWRRPIYFAVTVSDNNLRWTAPYLRREGLAQRLMPIQSPPTDYDILQVNLMEKYSYRGYNDHSIKIDNLSRVLAHNYFSAFIELGSAQAETGDYSACERTRDFMIKMLPTDRLNPMPGILLTKIDLLCQPESQVSNPKTTLTR